MFLFCVVRGIFHFREIGSAGSIYGFDSRVSRASQALLNPRTFSEGCGWDFGDLLKSSWGDGRRGTTTTSTHADGSHQWPRGSAGPWARRCPSSVSNSDTFCKAGLSQSTWEEDGALAVAPVSSLPPQTTPVADSLHRS